MGKEVQAARDREQLAVQRRGAQEACPVRTEVIWGLLPAGRDRAAWDPPAARAHPAVLGQAPDPATWDRPEAWVPLEGWVHPVEWVPPAGWAHPAAREEADGRRVLMYGGRGREDCDDLSNPLLSTDIRIGARRSVRGSANVGRVKGHGCGSHHCDRDSQQNRHCYERASSLVESIAAQPQRSSVRWATHPTKSTPNTIVRTEPWGQRTKGIATSKRERIVVMGVGSSTTSGERYKHGTLLLDSHRLAGR